MAVEINDRFGFGYYSLDEPLKISFPDESLQEIIFRKGSNDIQ